MKFFLALSFLVFFSSASSSASFRYCGPGGMSPDGSKTAIPRENRIEIREVASNAVLVTTPAFDISEGCFAWFPNSKSLFVYSTSFSTKAWVFALETGELAEVFGPQDWSGGIGWPTFSNDGTKVAFSVRLGRIYDFAVLLTLTNRKFEVLKEKRGYPNEYPGYGIHQFFTEDDRFLVITFEHSSVQDQSIIYNLATEAFVDVGVHYRLDAGQCGYYYEGSGCKVNYDASRIYFIPEKWLGLPIRYFDRQTETLHDVQ